jgi:hypothetical protein
MLDVTQAGVIGIGLVAALIVFAASFWIVKRKKRRANMRVSASELFEDESPDLTKEAAKLFPEPELWLNAPNIHLGGEKPILLMERGEDQKVRDLLRAMKYGMVS